MEMTNLEYNEREEFLKASAAVVTPFAVQALWLAVWLRADYPNRRNSVNVVGDSYVPNGMVRSISNGSIMPREAALAFGFAENDLVDFDIDKISYSENMWKYWTPTVSDVMMPEGFGASALTVLAVENHADILDVVHTDRKGWEYGHSKVRKLSGNMVDGFKATTNESKVNVSKDVFTAAIHPDAVRKLVAILSESDTHKKMITS